MIYTILFFAILGAGLLGYVKVNDAAEAYNLILPAVGGAVSLLIAAVLAVIHWWPF